MYPKLVRRFFIGSFKWKARRKLWGFCMGDSYPCYRYEYAYFNFKQDAEAWQNNGNLKPEPRFSCVHVVNAS